MMQKISGFLFVFLLVMATCSFSQKTDSAKSIIHVSGLVGITNNGISIVPSFSLGKPAAMFIFSVGKNRLSFEPDLRFSLAGKPWSFLFWGRYKLVTGEKFKVGTGAHLGINFRKSVLPVNGDSTELNISRRYLAGELFPRYMLTKNTSIGIYYLYSHGIDPGTIGNTHFITLNSNFSNIKLFKQIYLGFNPQFYYLKLDDEDGFFFTTTTTLAKRNFPVSISSTVNKKIQSDITGSKDLLWNLSLNYTFNKNLRKI